MIRTVAGGNRRSPLAQVLLGAALLLVETGVGAAPLQVRSAEAAVIESAGRAPERLSAGIVLRAQDRVSAGPGGRLDLDGGAHGLLELGPNSAMVVADHVHTPSTEVPLARLLLQEGFLRVVRPDSARSMAAPVVVELGGFRVQLGRGEYFFQQREGMPLLCVAEGAAAVRPIDQGAGMALPGAACYRLVPDAPPLAVAQSDRPFVEVREQRDLTALAARSGWTLSPRSEGVSVAAIPGRPAGPRSSSTEAVAAALDPRAGVTHPSATLAAGRGEGGSLDAPGGWGLNLASFSTEAAARALQDQLRVRGYATQITPAAVRERRWFRVQIKGIGDEADARALAAQIATDSGLSGIWVVAP